MDGGRGANPRDGKCNRNKPPSDKEGKGEKAVQETNGAGRMPVRAANPLRSKIK